MRYLIAGAWFSDLCGKKVQDEPLIVSRDFQDNQSAGVARVQISCH